MILQDTIARHFADANEFLAAHNHVGAAIVIIKATEAAQKVGWTPPPHWDRMTTRQRMESLGWMASPIGRDTYQPTTHFIRGYIRTTPLLRG